MKTDRYRKADLAKIHLAKKDLALCEDDYRAILEQVTGKTSSARLNRMERLKVLSRFHQLGFRAAPPKKRRNGAPGKVIADKHPMIRKIYALLAEAGRDWTYANAIADRMFGVQNLRFCTSDQLHRIISALEYDKRRHGYGWDS